MSAHRRRVGVALKSRSSGRPFTRFESGTWPPPKFAAKEEASIHQSEGELAPFLLDSGEERDTTHDEDVSKQSSQQAHHLLPPSSHPPSSPYTTTVQTGA